MIHLLSDRDQDLQLNQQRSDQCLDERTQAAGAMHGSKQEKVYLARLIFKMHGVTGRN
jgi:hypothetical protein